MSDELKELLTEKIQHLTDKVETGFRGVHRRQDIANGRTAKIEERTDDLEKADIKIQADLTNLIKEESQHIQEAKQKEKTKQDRAWEIVGKLLPTVLTGIIFLVAFWISHQ